MKQKFLFSVLYCFYCFFFHVLRTPGKFWKQESNESGLSSSIGYRLPDRFRILMALQKETFLNAVSIDNQKRIIESRIGQSRVVRTGILL